MAAAITKRTSRRPSSRRCPQFGVDEYADHPRRDVRGSRRRLARPRRALADHRGRVRRGPQGRRRRQDQDRRRRHRPGAQAEFMSREHRHHGHRCRHAARRRRPHPLRTLARRRRRHRRRQGRGSRVRAHRPPLGQGGAPRRPLLAVRDRRGRRGAGRGRLGADEKPYDTDRIGCVIGTGIGGIGTLERGKELLIEHGPKKVPPLSVPLMMSNAASARCLCATGCPARATGPSPPARRARTRSASPRA